LRDVGARDLADVEAVSHLPQLLLQDLDVAPLQIENRRIAQQVHVGGYGIEQHGLHRHPQGLAGGEHLALRLTGAVAGLKPVERRVAGIERIGLRRHGAGLLIVDRLLVDELARGHVGILLADLDGRAHPRAIAGQCLRHVLVGGAHRGALRVELRIVLIGLDQRALERVDRGDDRGPRPWMHRQFRSRNRSCGANKRKRSAYGRQNMRFLLRYERHLNRLHASAIALIGLFPNGY
jgi:hypothetical protein